MKGALWYTELHSDGQSEQGLCTSQCFAPGEEGWVFPGCLTQSLPPWVGNRTRLDKLKIPRVGMFDKVAQEPGTLSSGSTILKTISQKNLPEFL